MGIYSHEDRFTQHRYKADQAFQLSSDKSPVAAYLDIPTIVDLCVANGVEAVHPGYGLLSENANFAKSLEDAGVKCKSLKVLIVFIASLKHSQYFSLQLLDRRLII